MPDETEFQQGVDWALLGRGKEGNPYPHGTIEHIEWDDGWQSQFNLEGGISSTQAVALLRAEAANLKGKME